MKTKFVSENSVINAIIYTVSPRVDDIVNRFIESEMKDGRTVSDFAVRCIETNILFKLLSSVEKYTKTTDVVNHLSFHFTANVMVVDMVIIRDGIQHSLVTDVIIAGGYNIQCEHLRYITKTDLPATGLNADLMRLKNERAKMSKIEKLQNDIKSFENTAERLKNKINETANLTDDELLDVLVEKYNFLADDWTKYCVEFKERKYNNDYGMFLKELNEKRNEYIERARDWEKINLSSLKNIVQKINKNKMQIENMING